MDEHPDAYEILFWEQNLEDLDRELGRLATVCRIRLLDPGVVERVLNGDVSVCGADNRLAFSKLRNLLMMYFIVRQRAAQHLGPQLASDLESHVIERLRPAFPDLGTGGPRRVL